MTDTRIAPATEQVTRVRVLVGEDGDDDRRNGKVAIARSECSYYCPDEATVNRVIEALRESDERLRSRPDELMLWDWQNTWYEADPVAVNPNGGGTVLLGVAWYDAEFFNERRAAWAGTMHKRIYANLGVPMEDIRVTHWIPAPEVSG